MRHPARLEKGAVVRAIRVRAGARTQRRLLTRARRVDRSGRAAPEPAAARADVRDVADRLLPVLPHCALTRAARELAVREERARHLAEGERDRTLGTGVCRVSRVATR